MCFHSLIRVPWFEPALCLRGGDACGKMFQFSISWDPTSAICRISENMLASFCLSDPTLQLCPALL
ncbi:unnamed protein product [Linum tenue]|uniref:Uncharacterized protein n=1 Tax=Linum tenue TaxID=586396 RepID=A0AAV0LVQ0_9ROSI|nr:unnamed protein product [Linum tenue]